jgi:hypothetical protein
MDGGWVGKKGMSRMGSRGFFAARDDISQGVMGNEERHCIKNRSRLIKHHFIAPYLISHCFSLLKQTLKMPI